MPINSIQLKNGKNKSLLEISKLSTDCGTIKLNWKTISNIMRHSIKFLWKQRLDMKILELPLFQLKLIILLKDLLLIM